MYNGIGLPTPRGSGTNGYVQRNLAHVKKSRLMKRDLVAKPDPDFEKPKNFSIIAHQKKREIELKCLKYRRDLEKDNYPEDKIEGKISRYRARKLEELSKLSESDMNHKLKKSFGIKSEYVDGSSVAHIKRPDKSVKSEPDVVKVEIKKEKKEEKD